MRDNFPVNNLLKFSFWDSHDNVDSNIFLGSQIVILLYNEFELGNSMYFLITNQMMYVLSKNVINRQMKGKSWWNSAILTLSDHLHIGLFLPYLELFDHKNWYMYYRNHSASFDTWFTWFEQKLLKKL